MNVGVYDGLANSVGWRNFFDNGILRYFTTPGHTTPTQPQLNSSIVNAWYALDAQTGRCSYQGYIQFGADASFGANDEVWGLLLPVPCYRGLGGTDLLIGTGWCYQGGASPGVGYRNVPLRVTQLDPLPPGGQQSNEDYYAQFFLEHGITTGTVGDANTPAFGSGGTTSVVTHGLGITPNAWDIHVQLTNSASTAPGEVFITSPTTTQFTVNLRASSTTTPQTFNWKVTAEPNSADTISFGLLVNQLRPLGQWAAGWVLGWNLEYQTRR